METKEICLQLNEKMGYTHIFVVNMEIDWFDHKKIQKL